MQTFLRYWPLVSPVTGEFPSQRPVTWTFDISFDLCLTKRLSNQSRRWWFETPLSLLWRHWNVFTSLCCLFWKPLTWHMCGFYWNYWFKYIVSRVLCMYSAENKVTTIIVVMIDYHLNLTSFRWSLRTAAISTGGCSPKSTLPFDLICWYKLSTLLFTPAKR